ncbi:hypothetical protein BDZ89DRAFT_505640 [Hymenopellis radicata]|nr:hypothetical protein BDZ89DRAFT_505640 [Hymenopellis radicata]
MIIDELTEIDDAHATLKAFSASMIWWPEAQKRIRKHLFRAVSLTAEPAGPLSQFLDIVRCAPPIKLAVKVLLLSDVGHFECPPTSPRYKDFLETVSGMDNLDTLCFEGIDFRVVESQILCQTFLSSKSLTSMIFKKGSMASLRIVAALLCALPVGSQPNLTFCDVRLVDYTSQSPHRLLDFRDAATCAEFGVSLAGLTRPLKIGLLNLEEDDSGIVPLGPAFNGGYLLDLLSTSGIIQSMKSVAVEIAKIDINLPQRVQNLLNRSNGLAMRGMTG